MKQEDRVDLKWFLLACKEPRRPKGLEEPREERQAAPDCQEANLSELSNSSWAYPAIWVWCDQLHASVSAPTWAALSSITLGSKWQLWHGRTSPPPTAISSSFFPHRPWRQARLGNATSCHPEHSFPPGLKSDSSALCGKVVCGKAWGFVVAGDKAASKGRGGGEGRWGLACLPGALAVHSSQCRLWLSAVA